MPRRLTGLLATISLQAVALVLAHQLIFLARWGSRYNEALVHGGHGQTWSTAVTSSLVLGALLAGLAVGRLLRLGSLVRQGEGLSFPGLAPRPTRSTPLEAGRLARAWLRIGPSAALSTSLLLTVQENLERTARGRQADAGILLSPEYANGLWIALGVGLAVGLVAALFAWRQNDLLARLRPARTNPSRVARAAARRTGVTLLPPAESLLGRRSALRAPPATLLPLPAG